MTSTLRRTIVLAVALALVATACRRVEVVVFDATSPPALALHYLTRDGSDRFDLSTGPGSLRVNAPVTNTGGSTRAILWPPSTPMVQNAQTCAQWTDTSGQWAQQGLVLRFRKDGSRSRAVIVTKNVLFGAEWQLNVMTWDSHHDPAMQARGAVVLRGVFEQGDLPRPLPWRVCAKAEGNIVTVKGWRSDQSEPGWDSPAHSGHVSLPSGWTFAGKAGWYAGHIPARGTIGMNDLVTSTWELVVDE